MDFSEQDEALWRQVGQGLSHQVFDRLERFGDAVDEVLSALSAEDRLNLRGTLDRMIASGDDARDLWKASGAGLRFENAKGARMALLMLLEAVKARE